MSGTLVTPCHGARIHVTTTYDVECSHAGCRNSWTPSGIADEGNKDTEQPDPFTEIFPGTLAALDQLTIRKATP